MDKLKIKKISGRQIFDSRGTPTVEAQITLSNGMSAACSVPSGASTGSFEAFELRDNDSAFSGKGVGKAVHNINSIISVQFEGKKLPSQAQLDKRLIELDATENKAKLGANAILAVSLAFAKVSAMSHNMELFEYLGGINGCTLPVPMMNILNGGAHADNNVDIQEFMIMPVGAKSFCEAMEMGTDIYHALGSILKQHGLSTTVGDEGGYAPNLEADEEALSLITEAITKAGYKPFEQVKIALDAAASEWYKSGHYLFPKKQKRITQSELIDYFKKLCSAYPIISIEDPLSEEDFTGFSQITREIGENVQIVGDDLFVTNKQRLLRGIETKSANAVLIKPNQIGTLSETLEAIRIAKDNNFNTIISHRSGETEDTSIADIAVALNAGQIKAGAPARTDRVAKYNRLLKIEKLLGSSAKYYPQAVNPV